MMGRLFVVVASVQQVFALRLRLQAGRDRAGTNRSIRGILLVCLVRGICSQAAFAHLRRRWPTVVGC